MASLFRSLSLAGVAGLSLAIFTFAGCNGDKPSEHAGDQHAHGEHEEHPMPETFDEAIAELKEHAPGVKAAFDEGKSQDAHEDVEFLGKLTGNMTSLIDASDLTEDQKAQAKEACEALFTQYEKLDEVFHGGSTELKYSDVGGKIDESLKVLVELRNAKSEPAPEAGATDEKPAEEKP